MAETKITRKDLFARIAETMSNDPEVVEMCEKYIEQLSRPRKPRVNKAAIEFADHVYDVLSENGAPMTNKEMTAALNAEIEGSGDPEIKPQKTAHAFKRLVEEGRVTRINGEKAKDAATFAIN